MFTPDALSRRYEAAAARLITLAVRRYGEAEGQPGELGRLVWVRTWVRPVRGEVPDVRGRTPAERALMRALYRDERVYHRSPAKRWSLKLQWGEIQRATRLHPYGRLLRLRVFTDIDGANHARRRGGSYVREEIPRSAYTVGEQAGGLA